MHFLLIVRCSKDGKKLKELVSSDSAYQNMDEAAYDVIAAFTHAKELTRVNPCYKKGGKIDMCEGIRQLMEESKSEGFSIGRNEGISIGKNQGISIGKNQGISNGRNEGRHEGISTAFDIIRQLKQGISPEELIAQGNDEGVVQQALALL